MGVGTTGISSKIRNIKWYGVIEKTMLGTYRLQDPNGKELATVVHGDRLINANISTADELKQLWASPATED
jgi:hypothetical protein